MNTTFPLAIRALTVAAFAIAALFTAFEAKAELPTKFYGFAIGASITEARQACEAQGDGWKWGHLSKIESLNERVFGCREHFDPGAKRRRSFYIYVDVETGRIHTVDFKSTSQRGDVGSEYEHAAAVLLEFCGEPTYETSTRIVWPGERSGIRISRVTSSWTLRWGRRYQ